MAGDADPPTTHDAIGQGLERGLQCCAHFQSLSAEKSKAQPGIEPGSWECELQASESHVITATLLGRNVACSLSISIKEFGDICAKSRKIGGSLPLPRTGLRHLI
jgi:hypothetical protein